MKKFTLETRDVYDLGLVTGSIVKDNSDKLDFKEILHLQKTSNYLLSEIKDFVDKFEQINIEKNTYVKNANEKIVSYRQKLQKETEKNGEIDKEYKEKLDNFVKNVMEEVQVEIDKEIGPQYDDLYKEFGSDGIELKLDEEKYKMLVINFELYAKEKYNNKSRMVEVYETLISANTIEG